MATFTGFFVALAFIGYYAQKTLGTSGLNSGRGMEISLPASSMTLQSDAQ
jgi:hypothetical protein